MTQADLLIDGADRLTRDRRVLVFTDTDASRAAAVFKLGLNLRQARAVEKFRSIVEEMDLRQIVQEMY